MILADPHCHLQDRRFDDDREAVIARALDALEWLAVVGDDIPNSETACQLVRPGVFAVVGVHPYHADGFTESDVDTLRALCARPGVIAIGETGLDYHNEFSARPAQRAAFVRQLALAAEMALPVVIHNREADGDTLAILADHAAALKSVIMHCFGSDAKAAELFVELGCYVSFAGNVTFPKAIPLREAASVVPAERLLAETDSPYLAPQPVRGKRCEPAFVRHTVEALAQLRGMSVETMAALLAENARRAFCLGDRERFQPLILGARP
jgi:TatD DNase family protein